MNTIQLLLLGLAMTATVTGCQSSNKPKDLPSGASAAFTSSDPKIVSARQLYAQGKFKDATSLLEGAQVDPVAKADLVEIMRRQRQDYTTTPEQLLAKIKKNDIPDATMADLQRWHDAGYLQYRVIDGQTLYFDREPSNLYKFAEDAKKRAEPNLKKKQKSDWKLTDHLSRVIDEAEKTGQTQVLPVHHTCTFTLTVNKDRPGAKKGSLVRVWIPYPQEYRQQRNIKLISMSPATGFLAPSLNEKTGSGAAQRSVYFEQRIENPAEANKFQIKYEFDCYAYYPQISDEQVQPLPGDFPREYLAQRPPHIVFTPEVKKLASEIVGNETNPLAKARKIYYWIDSNIHYAYEEEYCTIPSFSLKCLNGRRGDCGIQSMTFITLCRAAGVPARWQSFWETKPVQNTMHDWTEIYVPPWGWIPCDPSYGLQHDPREGHEKELHPDPSVRDFYIGHQDSYRVVANLDYGSQFIPPKQSFRSEPADFQRGEVEIDGRNLYFDEWDYNMKFETTPNGR